MIAHASQGLLLNSCRIEPAGVRAGKSPPSEAWTGPPSRARRELAWKYVWFFCSVNAFLRLPRPILRGNLGYRTPSSLAARKAVTSQLPCCAIAAKCYQRSYIVLRLRVATRLPLPAGFPPWRG